MIEVDRSVDAVTGATTRMNVNGDEVGHLQGSYDTVEGEKVYREVVYRRRDGSEVWAFADGPSLVLPAPIAQPDTWADYSGGDDPESNW